MSLLNRSRPSKTAELAAAARAEHMRSVSTPVFEDAFAHLMCGPFWRTILSSRLLSKLVLDGLLASVRPIIPAIYTRARFGEDCLEKAMSHGTDQFVIVGAGYDTFALRRKDLMSRLTLYELDQAATQEMKLRRMRTAGLEKPEPVRYLHCDLATESLDEILKRSDFDFSRPAMISWFGVTYYLDMDTIRKTLANIEAKMAPGSTVVFDYLAAPEDLPDEARNLRERCAAFVARRGEPWISSFPPPDLPGVLEALGYVEIDHLEPGNVAKRYFADYPDLEYPPIIGLCRARTST